MIASVRVTPKAARNLIKEENGSLKAYLTSPALKGRANKQLIELLSEHFGVRKYQIEIIRGLKSRDKTVRINA
ncbi:MAG: DUF167 domain-containing protein [Candidatus Omnitrophota bacterium]